MTVTRGKIHNYLGMDLYYSEKVMMKVSIIKYIDKILQEFLDEINSTSATLVEDHLIQIRGEIKSKYLPEYQDVLFHHTTANLILLSGRAQR